jgi:hypothetical protein
MNGGKTQEGEKMKMRYLVQAADSQDALESLGSNVEFEFDTLKEAKSRARYYLTEDYRRVCEAADVLGYSRVMNADGQCVADFFRKE